MEVDRGCSHIVLEETGHWARILRGRFLCPFSGLQRSIEVLGSASASLEEDAGAACNAAETTDTEELRQIYSIRSNLNRP